ncbi:MAG: hypothetical protein H5U37_02155 [Caldisericia bacterium]|nr:hypothetical protein [Caldisericia bacterium]
METKKKLGDILLEKGILTREQLEDALKEQEKTGIPLGQILIDRGLISPGVLGEILSLQSGIEYKPVSFVNPFDNL